MKKHNHRISINSAILGSFVPVAMGLVMAGCGTGVSPSSGSGLSAVTQNHGSFQGNIHGGQQPVSGSAIQLYAVGSGSLGAAGTALIPLADQVVYNASATPGTTGALTDSKGNFYITGDYTCPSPSPQVYLVAKGGNSGTGSNSAIALMAPLGDCSTLVNTAATTNLYVQINELTTIASVYALAPFMTGYANIGAPAVNAPGLINAVGNFNNLVSLSTGLPGGASLPAGAVVPTTEINTLGNIIAACVNTASNTSSACQTLFSATGATDTIGAALAFAKNPGSPTLLALYSLGSSTAPFQTSYSGAPSDWTIAIKYNAAGALSAPYGIAIDGSGNAYVTNSGGSAVTKLGPSGAVLGSLSGGGVIGPKGIAIDRAASGGNIWVANPSANSVVKFNSAGVLQSGATGYTAGGLNGPVALAMDSAGNAWVANQVGNSVTELSSAGAATQTSVTAGGTISFPTGIALDSTGNIYVANNGGGNVVKLTNAGAAAAGSPFTDYALQGTTAVAVDASGNIWAPGSTTGPAIAGSVSQFNTAGTASSYSPLANGGLNLPVGVATSGTTAWLTNGNAAGSLSQIVAGAGTPASPSTGYGVSEAAVGGVAGINSPVGVAVDPSGNVWTANFGDNTVSVFIGITSPVVTPLAANVGP